MIVCAVAVAVAAGCSCVSVSFSDLEDNAMSHFIPTLGSFLIASSAYRNVANGRCVSASPAVLSLTRESPRQKTEKNNT